MNKQKILGKTISLCTVLILCVQSQVSSQQFGDLINVSNNPDMIDTGPAIAVDQNKHVHIAWNGFYYHPDAPDSVAGDIFYSNNIGGSFSPPIKISVPTDWYSREPTIAIDMAGNTHIAFRRSDDQMNVKSTDDIYYVTNAGGNFDNPVLLVDGLFGIVDSFGVSTPYHPYIHCDNQGYLHLTFQAFHYKNLPLDLFRCLLYINNVTGEWSEPTLVTSGNHIFEYKSILDADNHVHFAYMDRDNENYYDHVYYINNVNGEFAAPIMASSLEHDGVISPDIAIDSNRNAHIVYEAPFVLPNTPNLFYVNNVSGGFNSHQPICESNSFSQPTIAIDDYDFVHIAYKKGPYSGGELYYGNNINGLFNFASFNEMSEWWYPGSWYFTIGDSSSIHFTFYDWIGSVYSSDTEIFYLCGTWSEVSNVHTSRDMPRKFILSQNFPNPFNPTTTISYTLPVKEYVVIKIYNINGSEVKTLLEQEQSPGEYSITWDGKDGEGKYLPSGLYFYQIKAGTYTKTLKMSLIK